MLMNKNQFDMKQLSLFQMDKVKIEDKVQTCDENCLDNMLNFVKRQPNKSRKKWQQNYYIQDKDITTKCEIKPRLDEKLDSKDMKKIVQEIHRKRHERFKRVIDEFRKSEMVTNSVEM